MEGRDSCRHFQRQQACAGADLGGSGSLAVPDQAIRTEASSAAAEPADKPPAATEKKKQKRRAAESDDESDSGEEESDEDEDEESDDEGSDDDQYHARAVLNKKGKGNGILYLVDWEPELDDDGGVQKTWPPSWEPASFVSPDLVASYEAEAQKSKRLNAPSWAASKRAKCWFREPLGVTGGLQAWETEPEHGSVPCSERPRLRRGPPWRLRRGSGGSGGLGGVLACTPPA